MHTKLLLFVLVFVVNAQSLHLRKYLEKRIKHKQPVYIRDLDFLQEYLDARTNSDSLEDVEYDVEADIRDFENQVNKFKAFSSKSQNDPDSSFEDDFYARSRPAPKHILRRRQPQTPTLDVNAAELHHVGTKERPAYDVITSRPGIKLRVTEHALTYIKEKLLLLIQHDAVRQKPPVLKVQYLGMNITVDELQIVEVVAPELDVQAIDQSTIRISSTSGAAKLLGVYSAVFNTNRRGQFQALLKDFKLDFKIKFLRTFEGGIKIVDHNCAFTVGGVGVLLNPNLSDPIRELLEEKLGERFASNVCRGIESYVQHASEKFSNVLSLVSPFEEGLLEKFRQNVSFNNTVVADPKITDSFVEFDIKAAFLSNKTEFIEKPKELQTLPSDSTKMVYTYISDYTVNSFLYQMSTYSNVVFNLHRFPKVFNWLRCGAVGGCFGGLVHMPGVEPDSGRLIVKIVSPSKVTFTDGAALIHMKANVDIRYRSLDDLLEPHASVLSFDADFHIRLTNMQIFKLDGKYQWSATIQLEEVKVSHVEVGRSELKPISTHLHGLIMKHKKLLGDLFSEHLRGAIPLKTSESLQLTNIETIFRQNTLTIACDLNIDSKLFPHFDLAN